MSEKIQLKEKEHSPSLFDHILIKTIVLHQFAERGMAWEAFLETTLKWHEENATSQSTSAPKQQTKMGSSSKPKEKIQLPRPEVTKVYKKGHRLVLSSHKEKGSKPSSSAKQASTRKGKKTIEHDFEIIDL